MVLELFDNIVFNYFLIRDVLPLIQYAYALAFSSKWIMKKEDVLRNSNAKDRDYLTDDELRKLRIYWATCTLLSF